MATVTGSHMCSICKKISAKYLCIGCKKYFCPKDFKEHEQQLSMKFDNEIVRSHDELFDQIQKLEKADYLASEIFQQIEQWKIATIYKVEQAAEKARQEVMKLIGEQKVMIKQQIEPITKQIEPITREIRSRRAEENFLENDIDRLRIKILEIKRRFDQFVRKDVNKVILFEADNINWNEIIHIRRVPRQPQISRYLRIPTLNPNAKWIQNGITVAGGNTWPHGISQLHSPYGLCIDDLPTIYVADGTNNCIVELICDPTTGRVIAGGTRQGNRPDQLTRPTDMIIDQEDNIVICDYGNKRVVRWSRQSGPDGMTIIAKVACCGLTMDDDGFMYISDYNKHEVRRFRTGDNQGTLVAGGHGPGNRLDQLNHPTYLFVDRDHSVYVSDRNNHRVMKWVKGAKQGVIVAGGTEKGNSFSHLSNPWGIVVDQLGTVYVADGSNNRIVRWLPDATQGSVIIGGNGQGNQPNQLSCPVGMAMDREGNIYVSDCGNQRLQKFLIDHSP